MSGTKFTFKANRERGRHSWLRLTPAYSVHLVEQFTDRLTPDDLVLDPFCGTGTTALVCAERGIPSVTTDINPFLVWLTRAKTRSYCAFQLEGARDAARELSLALSDEGSWIPPMQNIDCWWSDDALRQLSVLCEQIEQSKIDADARDLLKIAFCQTLMKHSRANHNHQSISLKRDISHKFSNDYDAQTVVSSSFTTAVEKLIEQAGERMILTTPRVELHDSRIAPPTDFISSTSEYTVVITSPPYANRMSYIRELRPYMYWLGFLKTGSEAGILDWQAIGGTWGVATSNLTRWESGASPIQDRPILAAIDTIESRSLVLGRYIRKYIQDTAEHLVALRPAVTPGGTLTYIVGNSQFYGTMVDTERVYAELFATIGLEAIAIETLRKRTSKHGLLEFAVTGRVPRSNTDANPAPTS